MSKDKMKNYPLRMPECIKKHLQHAAIDNDRSLNGEIIQRLKASLKAEGKQL